MTTWTAICRVDDIPVLGARRVTRPRGPAVAVFRTATGQVYALLDRCPHQGGPISQGIVFGERVACPLHNWSLSLADGTAAAPDDGCTPKLQVRLVDGQVQLRADELATVGIELPMIASGPCVRSASGVTR